MIVLLGLSVALADPGLMVNWPYQVVTWEDKTLNIYTGKDLNQAVSTWPAPGEILEVVFWQGDLLALVQTHVRSLYHVDLDTGKVRQVQDRVWVQAMLKVGDDLLLADIEGSVWWMTELSFADGYALAGLDARHPDVKHALGSNVSRIVHLGGDMVAAAGPVGLCVAELLAEEPRAVCGRNTQNLVDLVQLDPSRLLTLEQRTDGLQVTRWSLLHPLAPWPFPMGSVPVPDDCQGFVGLPDGAWLSCGGPLRSLDGVPGLVVGNAEGLGMALAAAPIPGDLRPPPLLVLERGAQGPLLLRRRPAPVVVPGVPGPLGDGTRLYFQDWVGWGDSLLPLTPEQEDLARRFRHDDLPMGLDSTTSGSMPAWTRSTVQQLIDLAGPWNTMPLIAAGNYLQKFPDHDGELDEALVQASRQAEQRRLGMLGTLLVAGTLFIWLYRRVSRRINQRDEVFAAAYNPFRQDSPNNPERTPFAVNRLAEDLLRTLDLNAVVVEGPPFSGKSALLRHLAWRVEREGLGGRPARVVRLSLFGVPEGEFWTQLGMGVAAAFPQAEVAREVMELGELDRHAVEYLLDELLKDEGPRLVLVLDDLDTLGAYQSEGQRFRGLLQVVPSHRMSVLGSGQSIRRGYAGSEEESPWFNLFQVRTLGTFNAEELAQYLHSRLSPPYSFTSEAATRILERSGGKPLQVWHLCFSAVEHLLVNRRLELQASDVDAVEEELHRAAHVQPDGERQSVGLAENAQIAYEQLLAQVAQARRRRDTLLSRLAERERRRGDTVDEDFFRGFDS